MPKRFEGTLLIRKIPGRYGPFCVGDLVTEIGEFKVKDSLIDQFEAGKYQGSFWITQVYPYTWSANGKVVVEIRAQLADLQIVAESDLPAETNKPQEPDPADEQRNETPAHKVPSIPKPKAKQGKREEMPLNTQSDAIDSHRELKQDENDLPLFGEEIYELIRHEKPVKLDSTIDRLQLRRQIFQLGKIGYVFNAMTQTWSTPNNRPASD